MRIIASGPPSRLILSQVGPMRYVRVAWDHADRDEPVELYSELDDACWEVRKIEVFRDGRVGTADRESSCGSTNLGLVPVPDLDEIAMTPEFRPFEITRAEFDRIWAAARAVVPSIETSKR